MDFRPSDPVHAGPRLQMPPAHNPFEPLRCPKEVQVMECARFEEPVTLLVGMGFPARIESAEEAYALLQDWPAASRNHTHAVALNACKAGIAGEIDPETVRAALVAFARRNDILVPDMSAVVARNPPSQRHPAG
jgi:hypothetical protein